MTAVLTAILVVCAAPLPQQNDAGRGVEQIVLRDDATASGRFVRLLDLVEAESLGAEAAITLENVWLGLAPGKGETREITAVEIREELRRRGIPSDGFVFAGDRVTVRRFEDAAEGRPGVLRDLMQMELKRRFLNGIGNPGSASYTARVTYLSRMNFPEDAELVTVEPSEPLRIGAARFEAVVVSSSEDKRYEVEGIVRILQLFRVVRAAKSLDRAAVVRGEHVTIREMALESAQGYIVDPELVVGSKLRRSVEAGDAFTLEMLYPRAVIRRGDSVLVSGKFVRVYGTAVSDGCLGQTVRVKFPETGHTISCPVTGAGKAAMPEGK